MTRETAGDPHLKKRRWRRPTAYLVLTLFILLTCIAGGAAWLGLTAGGATTVLRLVSRFTPLHIEARSVEGRLLGTLHLTGVQVALPDRTAAVDRLRLDWLPHGLLSGRLLIRQLVVQGVTIQDDSPPAEKKAPELKWPRVTGAFARLEARISLLQVENFSYRHGKDAPLQVSRLSVAAGWRDGVLSLDNLTAEAPPGRVSGSILAGFVRPSLKLDITVTPAKPVADMDRIWLRAGLLPGRDGEQMAGTIRATATSKGRDHLQAEGGVGIARTSINLRRMKISQPPYRGTVTATGTVRLTEGDPLLSLQLEADSLDLRRQTGKTTSLSGRLAFDGSRTSYRGTFDLSNAGKGVEAGRLAASFSGGGTGITLTGVDGSLIGGTVTGNLDLNWQEGFSFRGTLRGRQLNPARIDPRWQGTVNVDLSGGGSRTPAGFMEGEVQAFIGESTFQGEPFSGEVAAGMAGREITVQRLLLRGKGFNVEAAGNLAQRLSFSADVTDLGGVMPGAAGRVRAQGWLHWEGGMPDGVVDATALDLAAAGVQVSRGTVRASVGAGKDPPLSVAAAFEGVAAQRIAADTLSLTFGGTVGNHSLVSAISSPDADVRLALQGGYREKAWRGTITGLEGRDHHGPWRLKAPAALSVSADRLILTDFEVAGTGAEYLSLSADVTRAPLRGTIRTQWNRLLLARANPWLGDASLEGGTSGALTLQLLPDERFTVEGTIDAAGTVMAKGQRLEIRSSSIAIAWHEEGFHGRLDLQLPDGGAVGGEFSSSAPPRFALPSTGTGDIQWQGVNVALLRPWLPAGISVDGFAAGRITAKLLPDKRFDMLGKNTLTAGTIQIDSEGGSISTAIRTLEASWAWRENGIRGGMALELARWGESRGEVLIPLPARLPLSLDRELPLQGHLTGKVQELGLLTTLMPGLIQETSGDLTYDVRAGGTLGTPRITGTVSLARAAAYVPSAGIRISNVQLGATLSGQQITVDTFRADSGSGHLEGGARITLRDGKPAQYEGNIRGSNFEALRLPELRASITPRLQFTGTPEQVTVEGEVLIPELRVTGETPEAPVQPSRDVIIVDAPPEEPEERFAVALRVAVRLGDHVTVKAKGIDAQLRGGLDLTGDDLEKLTSRGEIKVVKGRYKAYGLDLDIVRGRIFYAGGPIEAPTLDILALRTVKEVKAGVTVGGTVQAPAIKLYSEPPMPDVDIVAYMVLGHPLGQSGEQASLISKAAGALLSAGQSVALQDQLKSRLGLSTLELESGGADGGHMGYQPVAVRPGRGVAPQPEAGEVSQTVLTIGKYLTPKLYVSYGRSLFTGSNIFRLRYDITRQWQVETQAGPESGADLYYKIEFN